MALKEINSIDVSNIQEKIDGALKPFGMESHAFLLGSYNSKVLKYFYLPYHENTVAFVVISTPSMFEKAFIPFLASETFNNLTDPLDQCMRKILDSLRHLIPEACLEIIHDYDLTPSRRPKILMQTAGHVSGAARFYQRSDLGEDDPWDEKKKIYGVSIHPRYGGWFAFRAVILLKNFICKEIVDKEPEDVIKNKCDIISLLTLFNDHWRDGRYRDIIPTEERYSDLQRKYFDTPPSERHQLIKSFIKHDGESLSSSQDVSGSDV